MVNQITCTLKILTDLCFTKQEIKKKFCKSCLQCFSSENMLTKHKQDCLNINSEQSVKLEEGIIKVENYSKQYQFYLKLILILSVI